MSGPGSITIVGSSPTIHVFVPSSVKTSGFGARIRVTRRGTRSVLPERRAMQPLELVVVRLACHEVDREHLLHGRARLE